MGIKSVDLQSVTGYHAGLTYKFKLPLGFAVQPSLMYHAKAAESDGTVIAAKLDVGYLELPVSFQWGPDLLLFRPFLDISPFLGYGLNYKMNYQILGLEGDQTSKAKDSWDLMNRLECGLGLGGGLEVWKFQFVCRYNWNFGSLLNLNGKIDGQSILNKTLKDKNFGGVTLSMALLF